MSSFSVETATHRAFLEFWETEKHQRPRPYWYKVERFAQWSMAQGIVLNAEALASWLGILTRDGASASSVCGAYFACKSALVAWAEESSRTAPRESAELSCWVLERSLSRIKLPSVVRGKRAKMVKEFRPEQLDQVIRGATQRISAMIEFLADTGLRVSEMTSLRVKDIRRWDPDFAYVTVIGKGSKERAIFIQNTLLDRIRRVFQGRVFLFETGSGRPLDPDNVYKEIRRTFLRVAGMVLTPHNLRHYFATKQLRAGVSTRAVADYLGHSSPATTATWYDVSTIELDKLKTRHHGERGRSSKKAAKA